LPGAQGGRHPAQWIAKELQAENVNHERKEKIPMNKMQKIVKFKERNARYFSLS
jgi:hypothetical protein